MKIRVLPEAFRDLAEAVDWYDTQRKGLGEEFESLFYSRIESLQGNPRGCAIVHRDFRRLLLKRFPYAVYYREHQEKLIVSLVFHVARNPKTLPRLLKNRRG